MAEYNDLVTIALKAGANLSAVQYHVMRLTTGDQINVASLATHSSMIGVLQNAPAATGRGASVGLTGKGKVVAGAAVASLGVFLTTNGSGRAIAAASGDMVFGRSLETAPGDGHIFSCLQFVPFRLSGAI